MFLRRQDAVNRLPYLVTAEFPQQGARLLLVQRRFPPPADETLAQTVAISADAVSEFHQLAGIRIGPWLVATLHRRGTLPLLVTLEPPAEVSRAVAVHELVG